MNTRYLAALVPNFSAQSQTFACGEDVVTRPALFAGVIEMQVVRCHSSGVWYRSSMSVRLINVIINPQAFAIGEKTECACEPNHESKSTRGSMPISQQSTTSISDVKRDCTCTDSAGTLRNCISKLTVHMFEHT